MKVLAIAAAALGALTALFYKRLGARRAVLLAFSSLVLYYASIIMR